MELKLSPVKETKNYQIFKFLHGNRSLDFKHVSRLKESLKTVNLMPLKPIITNKKNFLLDGQHRWVAAKELGLPISYCVTDIEPKDAIKVIQILNQNGKAWDVQDFLHLYCTEKNPNYIAFDGFQKKWMLGTGECLMLLSGKYNRKYSNFKKGLFKIENVAKAERLAEMFYDMERFYSDFKRRPFFVGFIRLASYEGYNHKRLLKNLKKSDIKIAHHINSDGYLQNLLDIYNYKEKEKIRFK